MAMTAFTADELEELKLLKADPKNGGSSDKRDRMRTRLKKRGLIHFDRKAWEWKLSAEADMAACFLQRAPRMESSHD